MRWRKQWPNWWYDLFNQADGYENIHSSGGHPDDFPCLSSAIEAVPMHECDVARAIANYLRQAAALRT